MRNLIAAALVFSTAAVAQTVPPALFDGLSWRSIGPFRGGRAIAASGVAGDPATFYFGSVGGGVWKTTSAGTVWRPVFDAQPIASIGAIAVAPSNPDILYVGTGEADMRSDIGFGNGMYKSVDAGRTWAHIGLDDTMQIAAVRVDPRNPERVWVAALGHGYGANAQRGIFRTSDGGRTWQHVLDRGPDVGAAGLALDPADPNILYAAMWNARRPPWTQYGPVEGPGSGLFQSTDGGGHWTEIAGHGLPAGQWGRTAVAAGPGGRVYARVDAATDGGLFRSDDQGRNWVRTTNDPRILSRSWYFGNLTVDPQNPDIVYVPDVALYRSTDGGRNFTVLKGAPGGDDYHILWIDPTAPRRMLLGSDQGTSISVDSGATWTTWYNQPTAQLYHVVTDNRFPYFVYGCQQDSGTAAVASRTDRGAIEARDWFSVGGGEGGYIAFDRKEPDIYYVGDTFGALTRFDRRTGQAQNITPWPVRAFGASVAGQKHRYPWTAALAASAAEPGTLFSAAQVVFKTTDGGLNWREISPDLTGDARADKSAVVPPTREGGKAAGYGVIVSLAPSPLDAAVIWAGSDTGLVHVTRDGGAHWSEVSPKGLPEWSKVTHIEASRFDPATAWAAVERHEMDDYRPYLFRTRDYGRTWDAATTGLSAPAFLNAVREDPVRRGLLFAATELGVAVSFDAGDQWQPLQLNLPVTSVRDLEVHGDDLVAATHGRGFWILDDIAPLREAEARLASTPVHLFRPTAAIRLNPAPFFGTPLPVEEPKAKNPPEGATIDYFLATSPSGEVALEILDAAGRPVRRYSTAGPAPAPRRPAVVADAWLKAPPRLSARAGMNRFAWDLRYAAPAGAPQGSLVPPGTYTVRLTAAGQAYTQPLEVRADPRATATPADFAAQHELARNIAAAMERAAAAGREARAVGRDTAAPARISATLAAALSVVDSADRRPPAVAYSIYEEQVRVLNALPGR